MLRGSRGKRTQTPMMRHFLPCWMRFRSRRPCASRWRSRARHETASTTVRWSSRTGSTRLQDQSRNKGGDRGQRGLRLVAMRRVAAVVKNDALDRAGDPALDGIELRERPILVVASLNEQDRTAYAIQAGFDIPLPELGRKPDIVPAKKSRIDLVVIAGELLPQTCRRVSLLRPPDACDRHVLDKDMRRERDERAHRPYLRAGMDERDRRAVAVTDQHRVGDVELVQQRGERDERFVVHVMHLARQRRGR